MTAKRRLNVTINDVAADAGVSRSTVSLVLRGSNLIANVTKCKVQESINRLGYVYRKKTQQSDNQDSQAIFVLVPTLNNPFYSSAFIGINAFLEKYGYTILAMVHFDSVERQTRLINYLLDKRPSGFILSPAAGTAKDNLLDLCNTDIPMVFCPRTIPDIKANIVTCEYKLAAFTATKHLLENNHRRIAFLGGIPDTSPYTLRIDGYRTALELYQVEYDESLCMTGPMTMEFGQSAAIKVLQNCNPPTAILCGDDVVAHGVFAALSQKGLIPGEDVAVIGFDNTLKDTLSNDGLSSVRFNPLNPSTVAALGNFTTVSEDPYRIGHEAARLLYRNINLPDMDYEEIVLPQSLIIRQSSSKKFKMPS